MYILDEFYVNFITNCHNFENFLILFVLECVTILNKFIILSTKC